MPHRPSEHGSAQVPARHLPLLFLLSTCVLLVTLFIFKTGIAQAEPETPAPGWEITSSTFPTHLAPGSAVNEVQEVTVAATGGTFTIFYGNQVTGPIAFNAPAATVQADLEALSSIGEGNVVVTGGPEGEPSVVTANTPYVLTFVRALASRDTGGVFANGEELVGGSATDTVKTKGASSGALELNVYNIGAAPSSGPVTVTDALPEGVVATEAGDVQAGSAGTIGERNEWDCTGNGPGAAPKVEGASVVSCTSVLENLPSLPTTERVGTGNEAGSGSIEHIAIAVRVETGREATLTNSVTVAGGGALAPASTHAPLTVSSAPASEFGFEDLDGWFSNANGTVDTQAGSHPFELAFSFDLNTSINGQGQLRPAGGESHDLTVNLPFGFIGNPTALPQCSRQAFDEEACNPSTQVGVDIPELDGGPQVPERFSFPVYNLVPPAGEPAQFGFVLAGIQTFLDPNVRSGSDYGITVHTNDITQSHNVMGDRIVLWGEPSDPLHNPYRYSNNWEHAKCGIFDPETGCSSTAPRIPFLTLPTSCPVNPSTRQSEPQAFTTSLDTWEAEGFFREGSFLTHDGNDTETGFTGCDRLDFGGSLETKPDTTSADTPAGLTVNVQPQTGGLTTTGGLGTSDIQSGTFTLPPGLVINPGQAAGLQACQISQSGLGVEPVPGDLTKGEPECPSASKVGTVEASTPILANRIKGDIYVLQSEPPHLLLLLHLAGEGVDVKVVSRTNLNPVTGQITAKFGEPVTEQEEAEDPELKELKGHLLLPQAPISDIEASFSGGAQAAAATPTTCGSYTTLGEATPYAAPAVPVFATTAELNIDHGPGGGPCPGGVLPFTPELIAGSTTDQAGGFTDFSLLLQRGDGQQRIERLQFKFPEGFGGMLSKVPLCPEPQAGRGECSAASQIGHATVDSGPGQYPLVIPQPGEPESPMYLTGPTLLEGPNQSVAPFGLSIVTHVIAGPFNLGNVITRAKIEIDPVTAQITITTDPLPQIIDGVPTDLRLIDAVADRPEFMFNPTSCNASSFSGTAFGTPPPGAGGAGTQASISSHFKAEACAALKFEPKLAVTTSGKTSKAYGASLAFKFTNPNTPQGSDADFAKFKVDLPKQLPSRLTTLQKACTEAQFNANPAGCPAASVVGHMVVHTPELPVPVEGPMYFVSHGGEAFPQLEIVLQGDGVTVLLTGDTFISKAGITSSTFKAIPDVPFSSAEVVLPEGRYSALAANGSLCKPTKTVTVKKKVTVKVHGHKQKVTRKVSETKPETLQMPTEFVGQNGAVIHQSTAVAVTGCTRAKPAKKATKKHKQKQATTNRRAR